MLVNAALPLFEKISRQIDKMPVISIEELEVNGQMNRYDKKFLFHTNRISEILQTIQHRYAVIDHHGTKINGYKSEYFDTADLTCYLEHHNQRSKRFKIRIRTYENSGKQFLEIKSKNNKKLTKKKRRPYNSQQGVTKEDHEFLLEHTGIASSKLKTTLHTEYKRISLSNLLKGERVTIDFDLKLTLNGRKIALPDLAIAEMKNSNRHTQTAFGQFLHDEYIQPSSFSKYCIGMALLYPDIKKNNFKETIRNLNPVSYE
ncbi:VTC domain-containing protein [Mangrovibacterium lignilyticum]|uniref:VTC domain-containing protein n=1 Tax=Mangrovibacterium lignilyticum TaxID=2668052 RepID=UPI0013D157C6|nr:VTC domain-containing protein [Mangrovibacterium lignilyticum]